VEKRKIPLVQEGLSRPRENPNGDFSHQLEKKKKPKKKRPRASGGRRGERGETEDTITENSSPFSPRPQATPTPSTRRVLTRRTGTPQTPKGLRPEHNGRKKKKKENANRISQQKQ